MRPFLRRLVYSLVIGSVSAIALLSAQTQQTQRPAASGKATPDKTTADKATAGKTAPGKTTPAKTTSAKTGPAKTTPGSAAAAKADAKKGAAPAPAPKPVVPAEPWRTWGGPRHDFTVATAGLAESWPAAGPTQLWSRPLGDGYSAIAEEDGILYTGFRRGADDVVTAIDAKSGKTIWEAKYAAPFQNAGGGEISPGPYAMPQVVGDRIVMASGIGHLMSLDKRTGRIVWTHDLYAEFGGTRLDFGYSSHALPYKDTLIVLVGGHGGLLSRLTGSGNTAVVAFKQADGAVAWQSLAFDNAHSSPMLITVDGQPQIVALLAQEVIGFSPDNGQLLWRHGHPTQHGLAISTPVWGPDNILFISSAYGGGSRGLELRQKNGQTQVREVWHNPRVQSHFGTAIRVGNHVFLSSGHNGPAFVAAIDVKSGAIAWQHRGFAKAHWLRVAHDRFVLLDEDGTLALVMATPQRFEVLSQTSLLKKTAWTVPTMVGTRLYVRDRASIMALDLAASSE